MPSIHCPLVHCCSHRLFGAALILTAAATLAGCGLLAKPIRGTSDAVKKVPVAGHIVATPLDVTTDVVD